MTHDEKAEMRLYELVADRPTKLCELVIQVRRQICSLANSPSELIYQGYAISDVFTYSHRLKEAFIHLAIYSKHLNLGFNYGAQLEDPCSLLEGSGKTIRHIRIEAASELKKPAIEQLIKSAIQLGQQMAEATGTQQVRSLFDKSV